MRKLCRKHKIWGESWLYLRPYLKVFSVFNVLQTGRVFLLEIDLEIVKFIKKKFFERFFGKCENCRHGPNYVQKLSQNYSQITRNRPEQFSSFVVQFSMKSNHYEMKLSFQSLSFSLKFS